MVSAHKNAARPRRPRAAAPSPLTEAQLDEVRRAVLAMSGTGARSVSKHGIVVYLDKELTLPQPSSRVRPVPIPAQEGAPSAATTRPEGNTSTSKQRRSRRRLQERLEQRAAAQVPKRPTPPQGGGIGPAADIAAEATSGRAVAESSMPPSPAATSSSVPMFNVPAMTQHRTTDRHSSLLDVGRRRRVRGRRWPRSQPRGPPRQVRHYFLRQRGRLGRPLARCLSVAARRRNTCRRCDEGLPDKGR